MFNIMRLLATPPTFYRDGRYYRQNRTIIVRGNKVDWNNKPDDDGTHWYHYDWPVISRNHFRRLVNKGWLQEIEPGSNVWVASEKGKQEYRSIGPRYFRYRSVKPHPVLSKYRRMKAKNEARKAMWEAWKAKQNAPEPSPMPLRKEHKRGKIMHDGYRRPCEKQKERVELLEQLS